MLLMDIFYKLGKEHLMEITNDNPDALSLLFVNLSDVPITIQYKSGEKYKNYEGLDHMQFYSEKIHKMVIICFLNKSIHPASMSPSRQHRHL